MASGDTYIVTEHEVGKPFLPPQEDAQVVKCCGHVELGVMQPEGWTKRKRYVLVMWAYPTR